jgi:GMP synthase (glutamine-hydrolysing)
MRAIIIQHEAHEGLDQLEPALLTAGFSLVKRFRGVEHKDLEAELVVVLGGPMGVYDADQHPFLREELAFLTERVALERPCLGICLGAQLLAAAAGAEVSKGKNGLEVGVGPVRLTKEAASDPVFSLLPPKLTVAHWHADTYSAVPQGALLASSDRYTQQAFRLGPSYGLQFHPELTAQSFKHWLELGEAELKGAGKDLAALQAHLPKLKAFEPQLREFLAQLAFHFRSANRGRLA